MPVWCRAGDPVESKLTTFWYKRVKFSLKINARDWGPSSVAACMPKTLGPSPASSERIKKKMQKQQNLKKSQ